MVVSQCSRNQYISEKYKPVQPFKLNFLHTNPLELVCISNSYCKGVGNVPGTHCVSLLALRSHS